MSCDNEKHSGLNAYKPDNYEERRKKRAARVKSEPLSFDHLPPEVKAGREAIAAFRFKPDHIQALISELQGDAAWRFLDDPDFLPLTADMDAENPIGTGILPEDITGESKERIVSFLQLCVSSEILLKNLPAFTRFEVIIQNSRRLSELDAEVNQRIEHIGLDSTDWRVIHALLRLALFAFSAAADIVDNLSTPGVGDA